MMENLRIHLEDAWDSGFFFLLRGGKFDLLKYQQLKVVLESFEHDGGLIDKRLVELLWFIPLFVQWQKGRLLENGLDNQTFLEISNYFEDQCQRILGMP